MRLHHQNGVGLLEIDTTTNNAINPAFIAEINHHLDEIEANPNIGAAVLGARSETMFSPGLDVMTLYRMSYAETRSFMIDFGKLYLRLFSLPKPLVVALGGHAIAGGLLLAMAGDVRLIKNGDARVGMSEIDLGLPLPAGALELLRYYLDHQTVERMLYTGRLLAPADAHRLKIVDHVVEPAQLRQAAVEHAAQLARKPPEAFRKIKSYLRDEWVDRIETRDEEHLDEMLDIITSETARIRIGMLVEKLKSRQRQ